jgi:endogenous inhibitor of DNA gyrase (YacG/DUF329 family)
MAGCSICGKPVAEKYRPFCSKRCADIDLGRWLRGTYVIPGQPLDDVASDENERSEKSVDLGLDTSRGQP